jgi:hypothetical protein
MARSGRPWTGAPHPSTPDHRSFDAGDRTHRAKDLALERVGGFEIARELGARAFAREEHAGVLSRAVVGDPSGAGGRPTRLGLHRQVRGASQVAFGQPAGSQESPDDPNVHGLPVVGCAHDGDQVVGERLGDPAQGHGRLQRLHRRAREHEAVRVAEGGEHAASRIAHDDVAEMDALDEARTHDPDERCGGRHTAKPSEPSQCRWFRWVSRRA